MSFSLWSLADTQSWNPGFPGAPSADGDHSRWQNLLARRGKGPVGVASTQSCSCPGHT